MKLRILKLVLAVNLSMLVCGVNGQTSLSDLVNYSLEHSHSVKKAGYQRKEADYLRKETLAKGLPQIDASASYSKMLFDVDIPQSAYDMVIANVSPENQQMVLGILSQIDNIDALYMVSTGFQVTQLIYSRSYWVGLKTTQKTQELYSVLQDKTDEDVIDEVATAYYQAGSMMLQLQTIRKSIDNLKEMHRIAELSYQNDFIKESDVNRLQVTITNLDVTRQTLQNGVKIQLNYLKALAGMPADSVLAIDTATMVKDFTGELKIPAFNIGNVPSYQALIKQDEIYAQQIKLAQAKFLPTLAAYGKFDFSSYNTTSEIEKLTNMNTLGVSLSMPIFSSGANYSKVKQAQLKQSQLREDIQKTKDLLTVSYNSAVTEFQTAGSMVKAQQENRDLAAKVYHQTSLRYQEGMASMADLLNVNSDFLQADNSLNLQILKYKTSEIKMLKATGNLKQIANRK